MKKVLSLVLSLVMAFSIITGMDVSVFAEDTEIKSYNIYKADRYAEAFEDIFVGTGSSSYARTYYNNLVNDKLIMGQIVAWDSLHLIASPSYSTEFGQITKYDYYKTVLFDLIISKSEDTIATQAQENFEYLYDQVKNSNTSFIVSTIKKIVASDKDIIVNYLKNTKLTEECKKTLTQCVRNANYAEVASDVMQILEWCENVYDAIEVTANYCALTDAYDGTREVLQYIAGDTENDMDLRLAATACIECLGNSFQDTINAMAIGASSLFVDLSVTFVAETWKYILATIFPGAAVVATVAMLGLQGGRGIVNILMSQDDKTKAWYQLESNVICEDAIIRAMSGLKNIYLNNKTESNAIIYLRAVEMYKDDILLGFDYSIDLLEVLVGANLSALIGTYNNGIKMINELYYYRGQKTNNLNFFETEVNKSYIKLYAPDYYTVLNDYNNQKVVEVESISLELTEEINIGDTGYIGNYIDIVKYPENANSLFVEDFISLNEGVIKLNEFDFIDVVGTGECTIVCNQGTEFEQSITVTVGDTPAEDTHDYLSDMYFHRVDELIDDNWESNWTIAMYSGDAQYIVVPQSNYNYVVERIGESAFEGCDDLQTVKLPETIKYIDEYAFAYCYNLSCINIPFSIKRISKGAFSGCESLKTIIIPDGITNIETYTFENCTSLTSIIIPDSVTSIGNYTFEDCASLTDVFYGGTQSDWENITIGSNNSCLTNATIHCHEHSYNDIWIVDTEPTCTKAGSKHNTCSVCGDVVTEEIVATSHTAVTDKAVAATCTKAGKTAGSHCSVCNEILVAQTVVAATGHTAVTDKAVAATCTKAGKTAGSHCSVCNAVIKSQKTVAAKGHSYKTTTTKATLTKNGKVETKCSVCGYVSKTTVIYYPKTIKLSTATCTYNGKDRTPSVTVKDSNGNVLVNGTDYKVSVPSGRKLPGIYKYTITFMGKYSGTKTLDFTILPKAPTTISATQSTSVINLKWSASAGATGYRVYQYSPSQGKYVQIASVKGVTSYRKANNLKAGQEYSFKVKPYTKLSDGTVLWGVASSAFVTATRCNAPSITSVTSPSKSKATVKWSNVGGETGYQLYYATSKNGTYKKINSYGADVLTGTKTFSVSASGKTIYFKVRAYHKVNGQTIFGNWSAIKSVKLK